MDIAKELPKGLINWYEYRQNAEVLFVTAGTETDEALQDALREQGLVLSVCSAEELLSGRTAGEDGTSRGAGSYDYIVMASALELCEAPERLLESLRARLRPEGVLLLGMNNRLGIRYFCGDRDPYTGRNFDGVENYVRASLDASSGRFAGRTYSQVEMRKMLEHAGFSYQRFYSVFPDLVMPQVLYAEDYLPEEDLRIRVTPEYNSPDTIFLEDERMYEDLMKNGLFHVMANAYLVECPADGQFSNVKHVTTSMDRGSGQALATVIRRDGTVIKKALYADGKERLKNLITHAKDLQAHGVKLVEGRMEGDAYVMPYIKAETATDYFRRLLREDAEAFLREFERFWQIILRSSEHVPYDRVDWAHFDPDWDRHKADDPNREKWKTVAFGEHPEDLGPILEQGYIDLVCLNCFYLDGEFVFFDQEFCFPQLPANTILSRSVFLIYCGFPEKEAKVSRKALMERYHLTECEELWARGSARFTNDLRNVRELREFHQKRRRDDGVVHSNRQRINFSEREYKKLFQDIFSNLEGRKLYLFGSGQFAERFFVRFGDEYRIEGILDNNEAKWGTEFAGVPVMSPERLREFDPKEYKVIICIKNYLPIVRQLKELGAREFGIFDWNQEYPRRGRAVPAAGADDAGGTGKSEGIAGDPAAGKKYHIGYVAGVFDLFHIGHLNLLRRAKEQCDYLIVGIVSDEGVRRGKGTNPSIPFAERLEIVQSCRYVDEAVEIPLDYCDTDEAYRKYQFDAQFSGSDYEHDPVWLAKREFLRERGSELVFFPYTESTSSSKLKEMMEKKLL